MQQTPVGSAQGAPDVQHVGRYRLLALLGEGGMGRVYRARDDHLGRDVALKILKAAPEHDAARPDRFLREARAAGALSHPNILAVYDVGVADGQPFIVSELVDGQSLRHEIDRHRWPLERVLDVAIQIAEGLSVAHQSGLVHRDLKSDNVMVTRDGHAKIVDFGLAKAVTTEPPADGTLTAAHTVLGTAAYMSPEQARGDAVDFRSDVFSFGVLLYEMVSGRRVFERAHTIETLSAVLTETPAPLAAVVETCPPALDRVVQRCLSKSPGERYAATADLAHDLREVRADLSHPRGPFNRGRLRTRRLAVVSLVALVVAMAGAILGLRLLPAPEAALASYEYLPFATDGVYEGQPAWSPDGQTLAYVAEVNGVLQVMTKGLNESQSFQVTYAAADCTYPFWSTDGSSLYYISQAGLRESLWSIARIGGRPSVVIENVNQAAVAPDNSGIVFLREAETAFYYELWVSSPIGAEPRRFAENWAGRGILGAGFLAFTPDGTRVALWGSSIGRLRNGNAFDLAELWAFDYPSGDAQHLLPSIRLYQSNSFSWMPDSRRFVFAAGFLGASPLVHLWRGDAKTNEIVPLTVTSGSEQGPSVSPNGRIVAFSAGAAQHDVIEIPTNGAAPLTRLGTARDEADPAWAPDGREFAYVTDRSGWPEIWISAADGSREEPVVTERSFNGSRSYLLTEIAFAHDGKRIAYQRREESGYFLMVSSRTGGSAYRLIDRDGATPQGPQARRYDLNYQDTPAWSPDDQWIAFTTRPNGVRTLAKIRVGTNDPPEYLRSDIADFSPPRWSPDGQWLTCRLKDGIHIIRPDGRSERRITTEPWIRYDWTPDSTRLLAIRTSDDMRLQLVSLDIRTLQEVVLNADLGPYPPTPTGIQGFSVSRDGRILTSILRLQGDIYTLRGFEPPSNALDWLWQGLAGRANPSRQLPEFSQN